MTELDFLKNKGLIEEGFTKFTIKGDFGEIELTELLKEYKAEQLILSGVSGSYLDSADLWYCLHKNHVNKMYSNAKVGYAPTEVLDIENPNLWKPEHWKWYLDNYR